MHGDDYIVFGRPTLGEDELLSVSETIRSGWIGTGPRTREFESMMAQYLGAKHAVAVSSCTAALHLAMFVSRLPTGAEVITTPLTFAATANAIVHAGCKPVFADVDRRTMNLDPDAVEAKIGPRTAAIIPVHLAGRPCDMDRIGALAAKHDLLVIEDAAHAIEGRYRDRKIGAISPLTCFSFYVTKNMTTAEGGMVTTDDAELAAKLKIAALHGLSADAWSRFSDAGYKHYEVVTSGFKYNMTDIQAALGICQLPKLERWLARREEIWARYNEAFRDLPCFTPAAPEAHTRHARHLYTLLVDLERAPVGRDELMVRLHQRKIGTGVHYVALHRHPFYQALCGVRPEALPNADWVSERTLSLPLSANLTDAEVDRVVEAVRDILSGR